jgi:hypothetical protein
LPAFNSSIIDTTLTVSCLQGINESLEHLLDVYDFRHAAQEGTRMQRKGGVASDDLIMCRHFALRGEKKKQPINRIPTQNSGIIWRLNGVSRDWQKQAKRYMKPSS